MRRGLALLLTATLALSMTACGGSKGAGTQKSEKGDGMTYAVEAGSAGEAVAKEKGFNYNSVSSQADALMEVKSGTSDAAIIDLLMAGAMIGEGTSYPDLVHTTELLSENDVVSSWFFSLVMMKKWIQVSAIFTISRVCSMRSWNINISLVTPTLKVPLGPENPRRVP